jgi:hypothetical protein
MVYYRESYPFNKEFTNVVGTVSQYQILFCYLAALFIQTNAVEKIGLPLFYLGCILVAVNSVVVVGALKAGWSTLQAEILLAKTRVRRAMPIENAVKYDDAKWATVLNELEETEVPASHVLVYYYTSLKGAKVMAKMGIPLFRNAVIDGRTDEERMGIVFSLLGPHFVKKGDPALEKMSHLAPCREVVFCCLLPRTLCAPLNPDRFKGKSAEATPGDTSEDLVVLPCDVLTAFLTPLPEADEVSTHMKEWGVKASDIDRIQKNLKAEEKGHSARRASLGATASARPRPSVPGGGDLDLLGGKGGGVMDGGDMTKTPKGGKTPRGKDDRPMPASIPACMQRSHVLRAYQLEEDKDCKGKAVDIRDLMCPDPVNRIASWVSAFDEVPVGKKAIKKFREEAAKGRKPITVKNAAELLGRMAEIRAECADQGLVPLYHYTSPVVVPYIFDSGFRLSTGGRADGGVHFSQRGPACYGIGTPEYEENIIADCFGPAKMTAYRNKNRLDAVFVYGAESRTMMDSPGGRENAKMFPRIYFDALGDPDMQTEDYFLRPDRIFACFLLSSDKVLPGCEECAEALEAEQEKDEATAAELDDEEQRMVSHVELSHSADKQLDAAGYAEGGGGDHSAFDDAVASAVAVKEAPDLLLAAIKGAEEGSAPAGKEKMFGALGGKKKKDVLLTKKEEEVEDI